MYLNYFDCSLMNESLRQNMYEQNESIGLSPISSISNSNSNCSNSSLQSVSILPSPSKGLLNIACTNARSTVQKVNSLITLFDERSLHFCILTET